ncbi:peptidoglycan editing factor PgeF [Prevotella sp. E15-22]|uniref:peptidoglycan editing factor PgeF n=1 Tax=Prevotella sp. E15-22 TaxID=2937774 RepID=UPI0020710875|nr:peptidoglycan editing factor PgeF [Prevotella sp. E15-22]UPS44531.1 peptidoglycan editing factor PgeF [Prevotella sp. E15-22]
MMTKKPVLQYYPLGEGVTAFSSTRQGGYSEGRYGEFNINRYCGDSEEAIQKNREALCQLLGIEDHSLLMPHQVHLAEIAVVDREMLTLPTEEIQQKLDGIDALMTNEAGVCIGVSTADCIPVLLYDPIQRASCAIHAGWRGTVQRIVEKAVARMTGVFGSDPQNLIAQIGPGIHLESFEVGDEVYQTFEKEGFPMELISKKYEKWHIDLPECNRLQLVAAGIPETHIAVSPVCTFQQSDTFFSARKLSINSGRIFTGILLQESNT